jgi:tubulin-specific chaperone A
MAPSQLQIAMSALQRLVKEEASYQTELEQQKARIAKLEAGGGGDDDNKEFNLKQEVSITFESCLLGCIALERKS